MIFQFKISLKETTPIIWRRFQVEINITFHQLHLTLQIVMGWENYHLYSFDVAVNQFQLLPQLYPYCLEGERNCPPEDCGLENQPA